MSKPWKVYKVIHWSDTDRSFSYGTSIWMAKNAKQALIEQLQTDGAPFYPSMYKRPYKGSPGRYDGEVGDFYTISEVD